MEEFRNTLQNIESNKVHIWCGAGISIDFPCGLPSGYGLSFHIFEQFMEYNDQIQEKWKDCNEIIKKYIMTHDCVRPEIAVSCITRIDKLKTTIAFHERFASINKVTNNDNHDLLARLMHQGCLIYTTNFDTCIEQAYEDLFHRKLRRQTLCNKKVVRYIAEEGGEIYHLHGTFEYGKEAGSSIENVMTGFDTATLNMIKNAFSENCVNIFLGYSLSDDYDLNSLFQRYGRCGNRVFVCNHEGLDNVLSIKAMDIWGENVVVLKENTNKLLEDIVEALKAPLVQEKHCKKKTFTDWKHLLEYPQQYSSDYKLIYAVELLNQLGISYRVIDKDMKSKLMNIDVGIKNELGDYWDILLYNMLVNSAHSARKGQNILKSSVLKQALKNRFRNNFFGLKHQIQRLNMEEQLYEINKKLQRKEKLTNDDHEVIAAFMRAQTVSMILGGNIKAIGLLKAVNQQVCSLEYSQGEEMYMFASRLRYRYLLYHDEADFRESMKIYYDIGNLGGVISVLIEKAIVNSVENGKRLPSQKEWHDIHELIRKMKHNRYKIKCRYLYLTDSVKHLPYIGSVLCKWILRFSKQTA